ncbi:hypothetical protein OA79_09915 [Marinomonas sp. TW1]|nr:hypothetical protein OA79_09915 [Marinomonas sp. TW1]
MKAANSYVQMLEPTFQKSKLNERLVFLVGIFYPSVFKVFYFLNLICNKKAIKKIKIFFLFVEIFEINILLLFCC